MDCLNNYAVIPGITTQSLIFGTTGSYAVEVTQNGCVDTSSCLSIIGTATSTIVDELNTVSIFPNPSTGLVNVESEDKNITSIKVFTIDGKRIYRRDNINSSTYQFELKESPGVYIIEVNSEQERKFFKLIKN